MFEWIFSIETWIALITLILLEIVLGIDNIIIIAILVNKLPKEMRQKTRLIGLSLAMIMRIGLLLTLFWIMKLTYPLFSILDQEISGRDIILVLGGLFLIIKSSLEIWHDLVQSNKQESPKQYHAKGLISVLVQIILLDLVFSLDSVITAVGMVDIIQIMIIAVIVAVMVMMLASKSISEFIDKNPSIKILALAFLVLVGIVLIAEGLDISIPKGYIYFAMFFSLVVEMINISIEKKALHENSNHH